MLDPNWITAVCTALGLFGGLYVWFNKLCQARMPDVSFTAHRLSYPHIYRITIHPKRIKYPYVLENIESVRPLYTQYKGVDRLCKGKVKLIDALNKEDIHKVIHSCHQELQEEPFITLFIDLDGTQNITYKMRLLFKSEHFPFRWGKPIIIPVE
ncbi:hypothetical protein HPC38_02455 [Pasteurellaceae bacterium HPA106]|uniref:hypothetical protein n=1 Tax=Spirabiliibacterium pneumoniae TaxID=221400 RepID=UPI001AAD78D5|nr:hypothetical protein [Spirabiliibacterium pneumoniae]MBE2895741.1 hypothetical protein [Spirabiliibacterium pneumoniae]